jgi:hypothetical protein
MTNDQNELHNLSSAPHKKSYSPMKVSRLGGLTELTQAMTSGPFGDASFMLMTMSMLR